MPFIISPQMDGDESRQRRNVEEGTWGARVKENERADDC